MSRFLTAPSAQGRLYSLAQSTAYAEMHTTKSLLYDGIIYIGLS